MSCRRRGQICRGGVLAAGWARPWRAAALLGLACSLPAGAGAQQLCPELDSLFSRKVLIAPAICSTTRTTSTTTYTGSSSTTTTTTTSTSIIDKFCDGIVCGTNGHPWSIKCGWEICSTCTACSTVDIIYATGPPTPAPATLTTLSSVTTTTNTFHTVTSVSTVSTTLTSTLSNVTQTTSLTSTATQLPTPAPPPTSAPPPTPAPPPTTTTTSSTTMSTTFTNTTSTRTTTVRTTRPKNCLAGCDNSLQAGVPISTICQWSICLDCHYCLLTTTTKTTSTSTTTTINPMYWPTTTTRTTSTTSYVPTTATTVTTVTETVSVTTSVTNTTTAPPCSLPSPLIPANGCQKEIGAGRECATTTLQHPCVEQSELVFVCPLDGGGGNLMVEGGSYKVRCKVCGLPEDPPLDTDPTEGRIAASLSFGPNALDGAIDQDGIISYNVFVVDECHLKVGDPLATVEVEQMSKLNFRHGCCQEDLYQVPVDVELPFNVTAVKLMIVPLTSAGMLTVGTVTDFIVDDASGVAPRKRASSSSAKRLSLRLARAAVMAAAAAAATHLMPLLLN